MTRRTSVRHQTAFQQHLNERYVELDRLLQHQEVSDAIDRPVVFQRKLDITDAIIRRLNAGVPPTNVGRRPQVPRSNRR